MEKIRSFALVIIDEFDREIDRFPIDYADAPKNLGFELEFTTLESRLTTYFTSVREKKISPAFNLNFLPPNAYAKANAFKRFVQTHMNHRMVFEYYDTTEVKSWEGKIQKFGQEELLDWGGLTCPVSFFPATPKYLRRDNTIKIQLSSIGKSYPFKYPYTYGKSLIQNNTIDNNYFDEIPLRVYLYGKLTNPQIGLAEVNADGSKTQYSSVRFDNLTIAEGEHLIVDAIQSKVLLWRSGKYISAYDYVSKQSDLDTFLYAKGSSVSELLTRLDSQDTGYLVASYRQYTL